VETICKVVETICKVVETIINMKETMYDKKDLRDTASYFDFCFCFFRVRQLSLIISKKLLSSLVKLGVPPLFFLK